RHSVSENDLPQVIPTSVAVIGVGAFGRNHARVYHQLAKDGEPVRLVGVVDADLARADGVAKEFNCRAFGSLEQLLRTHIEVQAASVAVPTVHHLTTSRALMDAGIDVLVEKPVTATLDRKSTRLNSSHEWSAYAVFCFKKKKK